jgi:hypothetical protein
MVFPRITDTTFKAIETRYKGYRFRSRLEARWAVFLDSLGLDWAYEPEGYETSEGLYLPDFFVKGGNGNRGPWIEVKGTDPRDSEIKKLCDVCNATTAYGLVVVGPPEVEIDGSRTRWLSIHKEGFPDGNEDCNPIWDSWWVEHGWERRVGRVSGADELLGIWNLAAQHARAARFEHGEAPRLPNWVHMPLLG